MSASIIRKALDLLSKSSMPVPQSSYKESIRESLLSKREKEILRHTIKGYSPKQIADPLFLRIFIPKQIANIFKKLQVTSNALVLTLAH
jgi:DNA-binding NarL/FixJ family response regulator